MGTKFSAPCSMFNVLWTHSIFIDWMNWKMINHVTEKQLTFNCVLNIQSFSFSSYGQFSIFLDLKNIRSTCCWKHWTMNMTSTVFLFCLFFYVVLIHTVHNKWIELVKNINIWALTWNQNRKKDKKIITAHSKASIDRAYYGKNW